MHSAVANTIRYTKTGFYTSNHMELSHQDILKVYCTNRKSNNVPHRFSYGWFEVCCWWVLWEEPPPSRGIIWGGLGCISQFWWCGGDKRGICWFPPVWSCACDIIELGGGPVQILQWISECCSSMCCVSRALSGTICSSQLVGRCSCSIGCVSWLRCLVHKAAGLGESIWWLVEW